MAIPPGDRRNRSGCLIIAGIILLFILVYLFVGLKAKPENTTATKIQPASAQQR